MNDNEPARPLLPVGLRAWDDMTPEDADRLFARAEALGEDTAENCAHFRMLARIRRTPRMENRPPRPRWIEGLPAIPGNYWLYMPTFDPPVVVGSVDDYGILIPGDEQAIHPNYFTHHMPMTRPDPPALPRSDPADTLAP